MRVLVVDDSGRLRQSLAYGLRSFGMTVETAADGAEALAFLAGPPFDVVVLDLMMPRMNGIEVLRTLRPRHEKPRILVLSARDQVDDRVEALDLGADDYLVKPFALEEVRARIQALARRPAGDAAPVLEAGSLRIDTTTKLARVDGSVLRLTPKEYALLELLLRRRGHVLSRAQIFEQLYESDSDVGDSVIEVLMSTLRTKLAAAGLKDLIETRRGFGYVVA
jgi:two-component system copper resistance phosphate regulon response regulator CusR